MITVFELFEGGLDIKIVTELSDEFKCEFEIGNDTYFFHARDENKMYPDFIRYGWHLSFGIVGPNKYMLTGKNIPFKVLSGVKNCYDMFIQKYDPDKMSFIAEGEKKAGLYLGMFGKQYKISKRESGLESLSGETPYLFMIDKVMNENINELDPYGEEVWGEEKVEETILVPKLAENRQDSFWYFNSTIAIFTKGSSVVKVFCVGDIGIRFEENGPKYDDQEAVEEALRLGWVDQDLVDCSTWINNNWFEIEVNGNCDQDVGYLYEQVMQEARYIIEQL